MATVKLIHKKVIETFRIDYRKGIYCDITVEDGEMVRYQFKTKKEMYLYVVPDIALLKKTHWNKHYECVQKEMMNLKELENFKDFDKLYYVGGSMDGMVYDRNGMAISTLLRINESTIYHLFRVNTIERVKEVIPFLMKCDMISDIKTIFIPEYNRSEEYADASIMFNIMMPDELYLEMLGKNRILGMDGEHRMLNYIWDKYEIPRYERID